jgi:hypothetical protein
MFIISCIHHREFTGIRGVEGVDWIFFDNLNQDGDWGKSEQFLKSIPLRF